MHPIPRLTLYNVYSIILILLNRELSHEELNDLSKEVAVSFQWRSKHYIWPMLLGFSIIQLSCAAFPVMVQVASLFSLTLVTSGCVLLICPTMFLGITGDKSQSGATHI